MLKILLLLIFCAILTSLSLDVLELKDTTKKNIKVTHYVFIVLIIFVSFALLLINYVL